MTRSPSTRAGLALALASAASFSTSGSFARAFAAAGWSPPAVVIARDLAAALLLVVPALLALRGRWSMLRRRAGLILAYGAITVAACQLCYFSAVQHMAVGIALLVEYLGIVLVVGWLWLRGQRPTRGTVVGAAVAIAGLVLVLDLFGGGGGADVTGVMWSLGAAIGLAAYFILSAEVDDDLPASVLACGGLLVGAAVVAVIGALGVVPLAAPMGEVTIAGYQMHWLVATAGMALVSTAVPYLVGIRAVSILGPKLASFVALTEVIFAVLVAWVVLGELPTVLQLAGGAVIVFGVALVRLDELRTNAKANANALAADHGGKTTRQSPSWQLDEYSTR
jgi:drug/metabolite transporter (DMT)-like permease